MSITSDLQNIPTSQTPQPQGLLGKIGGFLSGAAKDAANTLLVTPAARATEAATRVFAPNSQAAKGYEAMSDSGQSQSFSSPLGNIDVAPQKAFGQGGAEQIGGQALKSASYLAPAAGIGGVASKGIVGGAIQGGKLGALSGALGSAGQSMEQGGGTSDVLGAGIGGGVVGGVTGGVLGGVAGGVGNIWEKAHANTPSPYDTNVANATATNDQAGTGAVNSVTEASGTMGDVKTGLGNQFAEAPKIISEADPNARLTLSQDMIDRLNTLKDTKTFTLPDYLRVGAKQGTGFTPGELSDIHNIYNLDSFQAQDLITKLNDLTYKAKASGDLAINQQTVGLVNDIKNEAQNSFGHVTDAQGDSVWNKAYQDFRQGSDAMEAMNNLIPTKRVSGEMLDPTEVNGSINKMMKMMETPQGRATLTQANAQFKTTTGYDLLNDPMGSISKLINSNKELETAIKGNFTHQLMQAVKSPSAIGRRLLYMSASVLGIAALGTAFRKQIGNAIAGQ